MPSQNVQIILSTCLFVKYSEFGSSVIFGKNFHNHTRGSLSFMGLRNFPLTINMTKNEKESRIDV